MDWLMLLLAGGGIAGIAASSKTFLQYLAMNRRGPKRIGFGPTRRVVENPKGQLMIEASRKKAQAIGRAELGLSDQELWDREFHKELERSGAEHEDVEHGDIIYEVSADGRRQIAYHEPDRYSVKECTCTECRARRERPGNMIELYRERVDKERRWG